MRGVTIGTGYVGLTTGVGLAFVGHDATCVDKDARIVDRSSRGQATIHEPPSKGDRDADTAYVDAAAHELARVVQPGARLVVVDTSTAPIGSARHVDGSIRRALEARGIAANVEVASNPEFRAEGRAVRDSRYPDRIVVGARAHEQTPPLPVTAANDEIELAQGRGVGVIVTDWPHDRNRRSPKMRSVMRGSPPDLLAAKRVRDAGLGYVGVGR